MDPAVSHILRNDLKTMSSHIATNSFALLSTSKLVDSAAIFVHGFAGHPLKTWSRFQDLILGSPDWKNTDAFFLGHSSIQDELSLSAAYIGNFISAVCPKPPERLIQAGRLDIEYSARETIGEYRTLYLIGHSAGGVILRALVLDALKKAFVYSSHDSMEDAPDYRRLICHANMRLFAPALSGARLAGLTGRIASTVGIAAMVSLFRTGSPSAQELAQESQILQALRDDTTHFAEQYPALQALRARIAWAHHDDIVTAFPYRHDIGWRVLNTNHTSVCKPNHDYLVPFAFAKSGEIRDPSVAL